MKRGAFSTAILTAVLCISGNLFAYSGDGDGTTGNPYQIANVADFNQLSTTPTDWNKSFILTADINLAALTFTQAPIAPDIDNTNMSYGGTAFTGTFDGLGFKINNLKINTSGIGNDYLGLFGYIGTGAVISNLMLDSISISGGSEDSYYIGGLTGYSKATICNCHVIGIIGSGEHTLLAGGLIGQSDTPIINCSANVNVTVGGDCDGTGGLVGQNSGVMQNCFAIGNVTSYYRYSYRLGGLAGDNYMGTIKNSYATGKVTGSYGLLRQVGGLVGRNRSGTIEYCYSTGKVIAPSSTDVGGLAGVNVGGTFTQCFWDRETSLQNGSAGGTSKTTAEMKTLSTFASPPNSWDFTNETTNGTNDYWRMCADGVDYPRLNWQSLDGDFACPNGVNFVDFAYFAARWATIGCDSSNNFCGGADIDISGEVNFDDFTIFADHWLEGN